MGRNRVGVRTRRRILDATRALLAEEGGEESVTLKAIQDRAGVGAGSFYNLFETKEEAIFEVVREAIAAVDPDPSGEGTESIEDLVGAFARFFDDNPLVARIYLKLAVGGGLTDRALAERVLRSHRERVRRFGDALIRAGVAAGDAPLAAERLLSALTGFALHAQLQPEYDFLAHANALAAMIVRDPSRSPEAVG
ncbi:MAG: TetR/AcrR family transcriptional regulator [Nitriliruptorales bacterium]|nr:TetR/AcrR family transcriptional regulator [Nitriliruptorales bacterium]